MGYFAFFPSLPFWLLPLLLLTVPLAIVCCVQRGKSRESAKKNEKVPQENDERFAVGAFLICVVANDFMWYQLCV